MKLKNWIFALSTLIAILGIDSAFAQGSDTNSQLFSIAKISNITYATVDGIELNLDLYLPEGAVKPPLLVWVHGGAWRGGSKDRTFSEYLVNSGYAMASLDFRLSGQAKFPAQVHDIKSGIRFLRRQSAKYGYDARRIAILGASSGGHLAALVGVTNGHRDLEGNIGESRDQSSDVHAIVSFFGASNLTTILKQSTPHGLKVRVPALDLFLGGQPDELAGVARLASPVFHVDSEDPPLLLLHGDQDPQMPINQSHELFGVYRDLELDSHFEVVYGAAHGGEEFGDRRLQALVISFLNKYLR